MRGPTMLKRNISIGLAIAALAGLSGCGGYDEPAASSGTKASGVYSAPKPAATRAAAPAKAAASATKVAVQDNSFAPASVKVKIGETITFENSGAVAHTVSATDGADFDSGTVEPGATFEFTASKAGSISYVCNFHPGMRGSIEVS
jgi:plastocyanin